MQSLNEGCTAAKRNASWANSLKLISFTKMKMIVSCNLNDDSEKVYNQVFKTKKGNFSRYINEHLKRDYLGTKEERLNNAKSKRLEEINVLQEEIKNIDKVLNGK